MKNYILPYDYYNNWTSFNKLRDTFDRYDKIVCALIVDILFNASVCVSVIFSIDARSVVESVPEASQRHACLPGKRSIRARSIKYT